MSKAAEAFRNISEVAEELGVKKHVLRFWEMKFPQLKPMKRGGGRRLYRPVDVALLRRIRDLLQTSGYTIKGVQKLLRERGEYRHGHGEGHRDDVDGIGADELGPAARVAQALEDRTQASGLRRVRRRHGADRGERRDGDGESQHFQ